MAQVLTYLGRKLLVTRLLGSGAEPKHVGWGTGAGTSAVSDTTLFDEKLVNLSTAAGTDHTAGTSAQVTTVVADDTYQVTGSRTATGTGTVTNLGLFDAASGGNLVAKADFTGIPLNNGDFVPFSFKLRVG